MTFWDLWAPKSYPKSCHPPLQISASPGQRSSTCLPSPEQVTVQPGLQATSPIPTLLVPPLLAARWGDWAAVWNLKGHSGSVAWEVTGTSA